MNLYLFRGWWRRCGRSRWRARWDEMARLDARLSVSLTVKKGNGTWRKRKIFKTFAKRGQRMVVMSHTVHRFTCRWRYSALGGMGKVQAKSRVSHLGRWSTSSALRELMEDLAGEMTFNHPHNLIQHKGDALILFFCLVVSIVQCINWSNLSFLFFNPHN